MSPRASPWPSVPAWAMLQAAPCPDSCPAWILPWLGPQSTWLVTLPGLTIVGWWQGPVPVPSPARVLPCQLCSARSSQAILPVGKPHSSCSLALKSGRLATSHPKFLLKHHLLFWYLLLSLTTEVSSRQLILGSVPSYFLPSWLWYTFLTMKHKTDFPVVPNGGFNLCSGRSNRSYSLDTHTAELCNNIMRKRNME